MPVHLHSVGMQVAAHETIQLISSRVEVEGGPELLSGPKSGEFARGEFALEHSSYIVISKDMRSNERHMQFAKPLCYSHGNCCIASFFGTVLAHHHTRLGVVIGLLHKAHGKS